MQKRLGRVQASINSYIYSYIRTLHSSDTDFGYRYDRRVEIGKALFAYRKLPKKLLSEELTEVEWIDLRKQHPYLIPKMHSTYLDRIERL